jgi:two-component system response regulator FixJ
MSDEAVVHVIDDDDAVRDSLAFLLRTAGMNVRTYESATSFAEGLADIPPGCIVTDIRMPGLSGIDLLRRLHERMIRLPVVVMTGHGDVPLAVEAMKLGAVDFLEKPFDDDLLLAAVRTALQRHGDDDRQSEREAAFRERLESLSAREQQVLDGLIAGQPNKTIAYDLGISARTVEVYRANVMTKMKAGGLASRAGSPRRRARQLAALHLRGQRAERRRRAPRDRRGGGHPPPRHASRGPRGPLRARVPRRRPGGVMQRGVRRRVAVLTAIAFNTYREAARSKVLYSILFFGLFMIVFAAVLGELSLYQNERVIKDVGLFALSLFGNLMAIFLGVSFVYKEIERKSIYNIVSKPIRRWEYFLGKFLGIIATLYLQLAVMAAIFIGALSFYGESLPAPLFVAVGLIAVEVTVVTTVALLFSSFSTPYLSGFLALGTFVVGKTAHLLAQFAGSIENPVLSALIDVVDRVVPALHVFNVSTQVTYELPIPGAFVYHAAAYGLCYSAVVLFLGALIFSRRDFA